MDKPKQLVTTIYMPEDTYLELKTYCAENGHSQSWTFRRALRLYWEAITKGEIKP